MTFWKIKKIQHSENDKQGKENPNTPAIFAKALKKKQINQISIDLWDTKIQPGLILCAIIGL